MTIYTFNQRSLLHFTVLPFTSFLHFTSTEFTLLHCTLLHFTPRHISKNIKGETWDFLSPKCPQNFFGTPGPYSTSTGIYFAGD